tara:strand:- start:20286 stop:20627 length:342 start_codon:yes stop_codon:yes gene_type:complete
LARNYIRERDVNNLKKFSFVVGFVFLVLGYLAFQNAIDNLILLDQYRIDSQAGRIPEAVANEELESLGEAELYEALRRGDAILQVSRAIMVFGFISFVYSIIDDIKKIKNRLF